MVEELHLIEAVDGRIRIDAVLKAGWEAVSR